MAGGGGAAPMSEGACRAQRRRPVDSSEQPGSIAGHALALLHTTGSLLAAQGSTPERGGCSCQARPEHGTTERCSPCSHRVLPSPACSGSNWHALQQCADGNKNSHACSNLCRVQAAGAAGRMRGAPPLPPCRRLLPSAAAACSSASAAILTLVSRVRLAVLAGLLPGWCAACRKPGCWSAARWRPQRWAQGAGAASPPPHLEPQGRAHRLLQCPHTRALQLGVCEGRAGLPFPQCSRASGACAFTRSQEKLGLRYPVGAWGLWGLETTSSAASEFQRFRALRSSAEEKQRTGLESARTAMLRELGLKERATAGRRPAQHAGNRAHLLQQARRASAAADGASSSRRRGCSSQPAAATVILQSPRRPSS